ncbi:alpha/beta fold hydrolase [Neoroseomonas oryzicola]|uniref:Alpha/beta fold hydrolase n=1 Tax=Neoroseomonas oryzicola TaxID=535904 RepID=A0A9X9WDM5_9PROT|nr:alpha/beta fold hydrolase [Neoroseomonas oryzicola]MBR0658435.1 alpha/beta fold hydrolase [Neoroseomonas oryzicola]NKE17624.1 alpha/beta fold hydrolase [Neoroseomonas oryzicola]
MDWPVREGVFELGDLALHRGGTLPGARIAWKAHGALSPARDNLVLYPTSYGAQHPDLEWLIGPQGVLDPTRWCVVIPNMFAGGLSSSPSNTPSWPRLVTAWDNVGAQRRLLAEVFDVTRVHAVYGWSMGAQQAYHWAAAFPDAVSCIVVNCGSARTAVHNRVFLKGMMAVLEAAPEYDGTALFSAQPAAALRAFGRLYAGWALSQDFYRAGLHLSALKAPDLDTFLRTDWEERFARRAAADLLAQMRSWEAGDIADDPRYGGDLARALAAIEARVLLMPSATDLYFRVADNEAELPHLRHGTLTPIPSIWGHRAGNPVANPEDAAFLRHHVRAFLEG